MQDTPLTNISASVLICLKGRGKADISYWLLPWSFDIRHSGLATSYFTSRFYCYIYLIENISIVKNFCLSQYVFLQSLTKHSLISFCISSVLSPGMTMIYLPVSSWQAAWVQFSFELLIFCFKRVCVQLTYSTSWFCLCIFVCLFFPSHQKKRKEEKVWNRCAGICKSRCEVCKPSWHIWLLIYLHCNLSYQTDLFNFSWLSYPFSY